MMPIFTAATLPIFAVINYVAEVITYIRLRYVAITSTSARLMSTPFIATP